MLYKEVHISWSHQYGIKDWDEPRRLLVRKDVKGNTSFFILEKEEVIIKPQNGLLKVEIVAADKLRFHSHSFPRRS